MSPLHMAEDNIEVGKDIVLPKTGPSLYINASVFSVAQKEVFNLMFSDSFIRFKRSPEFLKMREKLEVFSQSEIDSPSASQSPSSRDSRFAYGGQSK